MIKKGGERGWWMIKRKGERMKAIFIFVYFFHPHSSTPSLLFPFFPIPKIFVPVLLFLFCVCVCVYLVYCRDNNNKKTNTITANSKSMGGGIMKGNNMAMGMRAGQLTGNNIGMNCKFDIVDGDNAGMACELGVVNGDNTGMQCNIRVLRGNNTGMQCNIKVIHGDNHGMECKIGVLYGTNYGMNCVIDVHHGKTVAAATAASTPQKNNRQNYHQRHRDDRTITNVRTMNGVTTTTVIRDAGGNHMNIIQGLPQVDKYSFSGDAIHGNQIGGRNQVMFNNRVIANHGTRGVCGNADVDREEEELLTAIRADMEGTNTNSSSSSDDDDGDSNVGHHYHPRNHDDDHHNYDYVTEEDERGNRIVHKFRKTEAQITELVDPTPAPAPLTTQVAPNGETCLICEEPATYSMQCKKQDREGNAIKTICGVYYCATDVKKIVKCPICATETFIVIAFVKE